jgi:5'(3')-deoxyribonucleotidase
MRQKIAIDVDDVLAANAEGFVNFSNERWGTNLTVDDYDEHWGKVWETEAEETEQRALDFHYSGVVSGYRPFREAEAVLRYLSTHFQLEIVTSRRMLIEAETLAWIESHFPGIFDAIHFGGIWDKVHPGSHTATKTDICKQIGAHYLIDDQVKHCVAAAEKGIAAVLFGDYKWNQLDPLPEGVARCASWADIQTYFAGRLK